MKTTKLKVGTFMGQTQKMRSLSGFTLSKTYHSQLMKVPTHEHLEKLQELPTEGGQPTRVGVNMFLKTVWTRNHLIA